MSYKTELQSNNADLLEILNQINAMPEGGGGSGGSGGLSFECHAGTIPGIDNNAKSTLALQTNMFTSSAEEGELPE